MPRLFFFALTSTCLIACGSPDPETPNAGNLIAANSAQLENSELIANIDYLRVREQPGQDGKIIATLNKGDKMMDLGEVSAFTTAVKLRGIQFDEPWLKVRTTDGTEGWIYGGGVNFSVANQSPVTKRLLERRLEYTFGPDLAQSILQYRRAYEQAATSKDFAIVYRKGEQLRDSLVTVLEDKITVEGSNELPDLYWIEETIPGYLTQLVGEGTLYYLFMDYRDMMKKAASTTGPEDDAFIDLCLHAYPIDSVEYFFPAWVLQTWDYGGHSELGKGIHKELLAEMNKTLSANKLFSPEIESLKEELLRDILGPDNTYWYPQDAILVELDQIIAADYGILSTSDKRALQLRRTQFADAAANGIEVDHRSGRHQ